MKNISNIIDLGGVWEAKMDGERFAVKVPGALEKFTERKDFGGFFTLKKTFSLRKRFKFYLLRCKAVSYFCEITLNGRKVGSHEGMWDGFSFDVSRLLVDGENELVFRIAKPGYYDGDPYPLRKVLSGFVPDVCCAFGGIWDDITLEGYDEALLKRCYADNCSLKLELEIKKDGVYYLEGKIKGLREIRGKWELKKGLREVVVPLNSARMEKWSPENPKRYEISFKIKGAKDRIEGKTFWARREFCCKDNSLLLNGEPVYWRGILHWGFYDEIIAPNPDEDAIRAEIRALKKMGFNAVKHCLYIPRKKYLDICDEEGMLCWIEFPLWLPEANPELEARIRREYDAIGGELLGHPCVALLTLGCEMNSVVKADILKETYLKLKKKLGVPVKDNSGSGECYGGLKVSYGDFYDYHFYAELQNMEDLIDHFTPSYRAGKPWLFGEYCDSDTLRDLKKVREGKKVPLLWWESGNVKCNPIKKLKPDFYLDGFEKAFKDLRKDFEKLRAASIDHALTHRKVTLEETRGYREISGYDITAIRDVPIATSGLFDDLGNMKFPPEEFTRFNGDVVLLPAWDLRRTWICGDRVCPKDRYSYWSGESYDLHILLSNYSGSDLKGETLRLELRDDNEKLIMWEERLLPKVVRGEIKEVCYFNAVLPEVSAPANLKLTASLGNYSNFWPIFVYPKPKTEIENFLLRDHTGVFRGMKGVNEGAKIIVTDQLDEFVKKFLGEGGNVFLMQGSDPAFPTEEVSFWRESFPISFPHPITSGLKRSCFTENLRYFSVAPERAVRAKEASDMGFILKRPVLRRCGARNWRLAEYLAEYSYGKGTLIATTLKLSGGSGRLASGFRNNVFGAYLFDKIIRYLTNKSK